MWPLVQPGQRGQQLGIGAVQAQPVARGQGACAAQPGVDVSAITLGQLAGHLGMTDLLGAVGLLLGGYDVVRKEGGNVAR